MAIEFNIPTSRSECVKLDAADPLRSIREQFVLDDKLIYLDGNSLGPVAKQVADRIQEVIQAEWGKGLIRSWNDAGWYDAPRRVGSKIAPLIGANDDEVVIADSISVNLFKLLVAAARLKPDRQVFVTDQDSFPTDLYLADSVSKLLPKLRVKRVAAGDVCQSIDSSTIAVFLSHVDYRSGALLDLPGITRAAHANGALAIWDLAHSAGALPIELSKNQVDLAVGCGYKYLNGGPGAPAFVYARRSLHAALDQPLTGWFSHRQPFDFSSKFTPSNDIGRLLCGTPPMISLLALEASLEVFAGVSIDELRIKSQRLSQTMIALVKERCPEGSLELKSPQDADQRGSHVSFGHPDGYAIVQALIARQIVGDFRDPDWMRFGICPLYLRYQDIWDFVEGLDEILRTGEWEQDQFQRRKTVT